MEFNERLQKEVASKESIIVSLKASLRSRGLEVCAMCEVCMGYVEYGGPVGRALER